jgi:hypothetical protein
MSRIRCTDRARACRSSGSEKYSGKINGWVVGSALLELRSATSLVRLWADAKTLVFLLYQKGRDSRVFPAQDRAIDDFTLKGI